ncbi:MAG: hypothetical protein AAF368_01955 [Planctomycetota bacterium]
MPYRYTIDADRQVIFEKAFGALRDGELASLVRSKLEDPEFRPEFNVLCDFNEADMAAVSSEEIREVAELFRTDSERFAGGRWAIAVSSDLNFGLAQMFTKLAEFLPVEVRAFRDVTEAGAWLELSEKARFDFAHCAETWRNEVAS